MWSLPQPIPLEVPRFGQFARQYAAIGSRHILECLSIQRAQGGRIGQIMVGQGLLKPQQVAGILRSQAHWAARMRSHDVAPLKFPLATPLSLCLPCFNEAEVIEDVLGGACAVLPEFLQEFEIVVVDDGSSDDTSAVVRRAAALDDRIRLIRHERNQGYGAAVGTALRAAEGEWICFTDGDGQFNMLDLPQLLAEARQADVVIGYRHHRADNRMRSLNAYAWKTLVRYMLGVQVRDLDCAFKLFPRTAIDAMQFTSAGACISAEIMTQCDRGGLTIQEVPVNHFPRSAGKATGANLRVIAKAFRELPTLWRYRRMPPLQIKTPTASSDMSASRLPRAGFERTLHPEQLHEQSLEHSSRVQLAGHAHGDGSP